MSVGIGKFNGGGIMQLPHALPDDGRLAATMIEKVGKIDVLLNLPKIFDGRILTHPKVKSAKGTNIIIESKSRFMLEADGESLGHGPFEFGIIPRAIRVISGSAGIDFGLGKELKL
jgi:diacylglycerol kinase family enzyme